MPLSLLSSPHRLAELRLTDDDASSAVLFTRLDATNAHSEREHLLHLELFVGGDVFAGVYDVSSASLQSVAETLDQPPEEVRRTTLEALRTSDNSQYLYDFRRDGDLGEAHVGRLKRIMKAFL